MCHTHKYKSADENIKHRISWNEHQDPLCVCCQPNMVLANEKLKEKKSVFNNTYIYIYLLIQKHIIIIIASTDTLYFYSSQIFMIK